MSSRRLIGALLLSTAMTAPVPAQAGVVVAFVQGVVASIAGSALLGGSALAPGFIAGAIVGGYANVFFGTLAGRALLALGASALAAALTPQPTLPRPSEQFGTFVQAVAPMERAYGKLKKGGVVGFRSGLVDGRYRHWTVTLAAHSTKGPVSHHLDLREVTLDEDGYVLTSPFNRNPTENNDDISFVHIRTYTGGGSQAVDTVLDDTFDVITSAHDFAGHSYAAIRASRVPREKTLRVYSQGREPDYAPVWEFCDEIYDPRTDATGYSNNWALCFAHELVTYWGFEVDWDRVAIEADVCDEMVTNRDGGTQKRYTFNHAFTDDQNFEQVRAQFVAAANAFMWQRPDGKIDFYAGRWIEPTLTLTADDFEALARIDGNLGMDPPTDYTVEYREPANGYRETPTAAYVVDDEAPRVARALAVYGIDSHNQALRVIKPIARSERAPIKLNGTLRLAGHELTAGREWDEVTSGPRQLAHRFVSIQHPILPETITAEVSRIELMGDGVTFAIDLAQSVESDWTFDAATEEPAPPAYNNDDVSTDDPISPITDLTGAAVDGTGGIAQIEWEWTPPDDLATVLRLRKSGDDWVELELTAGTGTFTQTGLIDGETYQAQVRAMTAGYEFSDWKPDTPVSVVAVANTDAPDAHPGGSLDLSQAGGDVTVEFVAPDDAAYYATRIYRADYAAAYAGPFDIGDATLVRLEYGARDSADAWIDTAPGVGVHAYWITPINASGIEGTASGPETIEIV